MNQTGPFRISAGRHARALVLLALCALGGCASQVQPVQSAPAPDSAPDPAPVPTVAATPVPVLPTTSLAPARYALKDAWLTVHVGKTGKLARLGHNHLIIAPLQGSAWLDSQGGLQATAESRVADMVVDDLERRRKQVAAGNTAYASIPSDKNIRDTRANMLGERVLHAAAYPDIRATAHAPEAAAEFSSTTSGSLNAEFTLTVRGFDSHQPATLEWRRERDTIVWKSAFTVSHQQLGMTPFSALGGALRVADNLEIELEGTLTGPFSLGSD